MLQIVQRWAVAVGAGVAALVVGAGTAAASLPSAAGAPTAAAALRAADGCTTSDCGGNHNQVLV
jgi:hypothetical protein